ncbi:hypothetical protein E1281_20225 [Actinomadura sp. KC345]|uniref:hypothetical protein n=1 Tax=Actinomadura sp. KC345 TaxID=2530371 RepID=UPI0010462F5C|nr:hypothetical protein [Actinomadura sp. KC345]TDC51553.1 hypothetical protein E1281_20225 [Actinomadura sp. KC345]
MVVSLLSLDVWLTVEGDVRSIARRSCSDHEIDLQEIGILATTLAVVATGGCVAALETRFIRDLKVGDTACLAGIPPVPVRS